MFLLRKFIFRFDWVLIGSALLLAFLGMLSIYSSSAGLGDFSNFEKQAAFLAVGILLMFGFSFLDWRIFKENSFLVLALYIFSLLFLAGLFFFAPETRGVKGWYKVGAVSIDPIEFVKIVLIILLAKFFSKRHAELYRVRHILLSGFYLLVPSALIFFQPDMGSVLILLALWGGILVVSGIKLKHFFLLLLAGILIFSLVWSFAMADYQKQRVVNFLSPSDPLGEGWSQNQAKIAIGSGGLWGKGFQSGSQTQHGFLPEPQTDFVFAAISEEFGLAGAAGLMILYSVFLWRVFRIAFLSKKNFPRLFATGIAIIVMAEIFIHTGMNLGILPIIGISLPFVSYGGSGLIALFVSLGILQNIYSNQ